MDPLAGARVSGSPASATFCALPDFTEWLFAILLLFLRMMYVKIQPMSV